MHAERDRTIGRVPLNGLVRTRQHLDTDRGLELDTRAAAIAARTGLGQQPPTPSWSSMLNTARNYVDQGRSTY